MSGAPSAPVVGVGGVLVREGKVVLIQRGKAPLRGHWSLPGGTVELGEPLVQALVREVREETSLAVSVVELLTVFDRIERVGRHVRSHFVIVDYLCEVTGGELRAGSDAADAVPVAPGELDSYGLTPKADEVIRKGLAVWNARAVPTSQAGGPEQS